MKHKRKLCERPAFKITDDGDGPGSFEGYASTFGNKDYAGEIVVKGAFVKCLDRFKADGFIAVGHDWEGLPVATVTEAKEDSVGLWVKGEFHSTPEAQSARTVMKERLDRGKSVGLSIGYEVKDAEMTAKGRLLKELELFEFSIVTVPCNPLAGATGAKSADGKGQYLGAYVEADATYSAIYSAWYDLIYGPIYEALYDWDSDADTLEERQALVAGALAEFTELAQRIFTALMTPAAVDQQNAESGEPWDEMLKALWPKLDLKDSSAAALTAARFDTQIGAALTAVSGVITRGKSLADVRAKQGRSPLAESRRTQLLELKATLDTLLLETQPAADPVRITAIKLDLLKLDLSRLEPHEAPAGV